MELTPKQVARLDNLLCYYREHSEGGGCTTSDSVSIVFYRNCFPLSRERLVDSTCESGLLADADPRDLAALGRRDAPVLSLWSVVDQAARATKRGRSLVRYRETPREQTGAYQALRQRERDARRAEKAQKMVRELPGYASLCREFRVKEVIPGGVNGIPAAFYATLVATRPRVVDSAWWFDPETNGRPQYDWNLFLAVHREVERVVARHSWIAEWKRCGPGRTAEAHILGVTPTDETDVATSVLPTWKLAGLKGQPRDQILLRRGGNTWAELYFSKDDPRALVIADSPADDDEVSRSGHWLDNLNLFSSPNQGVPDYVVVNPDGTWKRGTSP